MHHCYQQYNPEELAELRAIGTTWSEISAILVNRQIEVLKSASIPKKEWRDRLRYITPDAVRMYCTRREIGAHKRGRRVDIPEADLRRLRRNKLTYAEIGLLYDCNRQTVQRRFDELRDPNRKRAKIAREKRRSRSKKK